VTSGTERAVTVLVVVADRHARPRDVAGATARHVLTEAYGLAVIDVISVHSDTPRFRGGHVTWRVVTRARGPEPALAAAVASADRGVTWAVDGPWAPR